VKGSLVFPPALNQTLTLSPGRVPVTAPRTRWKWTEALSPYRTPPAHSTAGACRLVPAPTCQCIVTGPNRRRTVACTGCGSPYETGNASTVNGATVLPRCDTGLVGSTAERATSRAKGRFSWYSSSTSASLSGKAKVLPGAPSPSSTVKASVPRLAWAQLIVSPLVG
jgi:hypothetical protein